MTLATDKKVGNRKRLNRKAASTARQQWLIALDHRYLYSVYASSLLGLPEASTFEQPAVDRFPGWVMLCSGSISNDLLPEEGAGIQPVIVSLELEGVQGNVLAMDESGSWVHTHYPNELNADTKTLLIPGPLPISSIVKLTYASRADAQAVLSKAQDYLGQGSLFPQRGAFTQKKLTTDLFAQNSGAAVGIRPQDRQFLEVLLRQQATADAVGGVLGTLYHLAKRSAAAHTLFKSAFDSSDTTVFPEKGQAHLHALKGLLPNLAEWLRTGKWPESADIQVVLLRDTIDALTGAGDALAPADQRYPDAVKAIVERLTKRATETQDHQYRQALSKLTEVLNTLSGMPEKNLGRTIRRAPKTFL